MRKINFKKLAVTTLWVVAILFIATFSYVLIGSIAKNATYGLPFVPLVMAIAVSGVSLIVVVIWAIPIHLVFEHLKLTSVVWYILAAIVPSFAFIYSIKPLEKFGRDSPTDLLEQAFSCSILGALGATIFWYILVHRERITR